MTNTNGLIGGLCHVAPTPFTSASQNLMIRRCFHPMPSNIDSPESAYAMQSEPLPYRLPSAGSCELEIWGRRAISSQLLLPLTTHPLTLIFVWNPLPSFNLPSTLGPRMQRQKNALLAAAVHTAQRFRCFWYGRCRAQSGRRLQPFCETHIGNLVAMLHAAMWRFKCSS